MNDKHVGYFVGYYEDEGCSFSEVFAKRKIHNTLADAVLEMKESKIPHSGVIEFTLTLIPERMTSAINILPTLLS